METLPRGSAVHVVCRPCLHKITDGDWFGAAWRLFIAEDYDIVVCPHMQNPNSVATYVFDALKGT